MSYADRILMCQNPDGPHEHVPRDPGFDPSVCFMGRDCCTPRVYVAADVAYPVAVGDDDAYLEETAALMAADSAALTNKRGPDA